MMPQHSQRRPHGDGHGRRNRDDKRAGRRPSRVDEPEESEEESGSDKGRVDSRDETSDDARTVTRSPAIPIARPRTTTQGSWTGEGNVGSPPSYAARPFADTAGLSSSPSLAASPGYGRSLASQANRTVNPGSTKKAAAPTVVAYGATSSDKSKSSAHANVPSESKSSTYRSQTLSNTDRTTGVESTVAIGNSVETAAELREKGVHVHKAIHRSKTTNAGGTRTTSRYAVSREKKKDFRVGTVIEIRWAEPASGTTGVTVITRLPTDAGFTTTRRFVVVAEGSRHSAVVPILTYHSQGAPAGERLRHSIVHTDLPCPAALENELRPSRQGDTLTEPPILITPSIPTNRLDPHARINYGRVYQLDQDSVEIHVFGWVSGNSLQSFLYNFRVVQLGLGYNVQALSATVPQQRNTTQQGSAAGGGDSNRPQHATAQQAAVSGGSSSSRQPATTASFAARAVAGSHPEYQRTQRPAPTSSYPQTATSLRQNEQTQSAQGSSSTSQNKVATTSRGYQQTQTSAAPNTASQTPAYHRQNSQIQQTVALNPTHQSSSIHRQTQQLPERPAQRPSGQQEPRQAAAPASTTANVPQAVSHLRARAAWSGLPSGAMSTTVEAGLAARSATEQFTWFLHWLYRNDREAYNRNHDKIQDTLSQLGGR